MEVLTPAAVSVCVAPATAEPDARVVMDWLAKPLLPLKPNVPTPPLEILDTVIDGTVGAAHTPGSEIALALVVTVPPDVKARPDKVAPAPMDIPAFPMTVPMKVELAPSVVAAVGAQNTLPAQAPPLRETMESAAVLSLNGGFKPERWAVRPIRQPHHSASSVALVGGGETSDAFPEKCH